MNPINLTSIPSHFGDVEQSKVSPVNRRPVSHIEQRLTYVNNLPVPVTIEWRSGFKFTLPVEPCMESATLIVRVEIFISRMAKKDAEKLLSTIEDTASKELQNMRKSFSVQIKENTYGGAKIVLDYHITLEELQLRGGTVYYHELDCLVSLFSMDEVPPHPFSQKGMHQQVVTGSPVDHDGLGFGYAVEIVDNTAKYGERYLNIHNKIYKVTPKKDYSLRDGVYITSNYAVEGELGVSGVNVRYHPFSDTENLLGLYSTYEDAIALGDPASMRKQEITTLEHELSKNRAVLQQARQEFDAQTLTRDQELLRLQSVAEQEKLGREKAEHAMDLERQRSKDYFEERSYVRKDSSESIKFLPSVIMGIGAVFLAIKAFL